jgi:hypothetical protein
MKQIAWGIAWGILGGVIISLYSYNLINISSKWSDTFRIGFDVLAIIWGILLILGYIYDWYN